MAKGDAYFAEEKYREASVEYRNALQLDPRFAEGYYKLAESFAAVSDVRNALSAYIRAADLAPDHIDAQLKASNLLLLARQYEDVRARTRSVLAKNPNNAAALLALGNALAGLRSFDEAVAANERAVVLDPTRSGNYLNLGALQFISGNAAEAEAAYLRAVEVEPDSPDTHLGLATFYLAAGRAAESERVLLKAIEINPSHVASNRQLAIIYLNTGRPDMAEARLKKIVELTNDTASRVALSDFYVTVGRMTEAVQVLEEVLASDRISADKHAFATAKVRIALIHLVGGRDDEATRVLDEALARDPRSANALAVKAHVLIRAQRLREAEEVAESAVIADLRSTRAHFAKGKVLLALGRIDDARKSFRDVIQLDPGSSEAYMELAQIHVTRREIDSAIVSAEQAVASQRGSVDAQLLLTRTLMVRPADRPRAEAQMATLVRLFPGSADVHFARGELAMEKGDEAAAKQAFEHALRLDHTAWHSLDRLISIEVKGKRFAEARRRVEAALARAPEAPAALLIAAKTFAADGDNRTAERYLRRLIDIEPSNLEAYTTLAALYLIEHRLDAARREFMQIANRQPQSVAPPTMVGIISEALKDRPTAIEWYRKALRIDARAGAAANNLAWLYAENDEQLDVALQLAQVAYSELPASAEVLDTLGWVYYKRDMITPALSMLQRSVDQDPRNPIYHYHLGMLYAKRGDDTKARAALERALALRPDFESADNARRTLASLLY